MERKEIVKALAEHFGVESKYMGAPSFAYEITTLQETYTGTIELLLSYIFRFSL